MELSQGERGVLPLDGPSLEELHLGTADDREGARLEPAVELAREHMLRVRIRQVKHPLQKCVPHRGLDRLAVPFRHVVVVGDGLGKSGRQDGQGLEEAG